MCLSFAVDEEKLGKTVSVDLKPGGADIDVTDENKEEYVKLLIEHRFQRRIGPQMKSFMKGFEEVDAGGGG